VAQICIGNQNNAETIKEERSTLSGPRALNLRLACDFTVYLLAVCRAGQNTDGKAGISYPESSSVTLSYGPCSHVGIRYMRGL